MIDERITRLLRAPLPYEVRLVRHSSEDDPEIAWRLWVLDVPRGKLCEAQDAVLSVALELFGDDPLPFFVSVATPEKTRALFPTAPVAVTVSYISVQLAAFARSVPSRFVVQSSATNTAATGDTVSTYRTSNGRSLGELHVA